MLSLLPSLMPVEFREIRNERGGGTLFPSRLSSCVGYTLRRTTFLKLHGQR